MNLVSYISVVGVGLFLIGWGAMVIDLQTRVKELERRMEDK